MCENSKCNNLNNKNFCESKKIYVTCEDCKNCSEKKDNSLNENLRIIID